MLPLLSLGIPGAGATAVLLGAFLMWGLQPGPMLIVNDPEFVWGLIASMYLGNIILITMSIFAIPLFVKFLDIPYANVVPVIVLLCVIGAFAINASIVETWILVVSGFVGFAMKKYGYSPAATVLALVLGSMAEETFLQTYIISQGTMSLFWERPVSLVLSLVLLSVVVTPLALSVLARLRANVARANGGT